MRLHPRMARLFYTRFKVLKVRLMDRRPYWWLHGKLEWFKFKVKKLRYTGESKTQEARNSALPVLKLAGWVCVTAPLTAIILKCLDHWFSPELRRFLVPADDQLAFFSTVAQIAAVVAGLYYTGLTLLIGTAFKDAPSGIRDLVRENAVLPFFGMTLFLAALAISQLGIAEMRKSPMPISETVLLLTIVICLFSFVRLGSGLFKLLDIDGLILSGTTDLFKHARAAAIPSRYAWRNEYQEYFRRLASRTLDIIRELVALRIDPRYFATPSQRQRSSTTIIAAITIFGEIK